jgi:hypothetical protein
VLVFRFFQVNLFGVSIKAPSYSHSVRALCRYTRESVNRVKLREIGGLRLFVRVLTGRSSADSDLHDVVIESIKNFAYDDKSLMVLQNEGQSLTYFQIFVNISTSLILLFSLSLFLTHTHTRTHTLL